MPNGARGEDIPLEIHIVHLSDVIEVHLRTGGLAQAVEVAQSRRGTQFSPAVADVFERDAAALVEGLLGMDAGPRLWRQAPDRDRTLDGEEIELLRAMADFVDLKHPLRATRGALRSARPQRPDAGVCRRRISHVCSVRASSTASAD